MNPTLLVASIALTASSLAAQIDGAFRGFTSSQEVQATGSALGWDVAVAGDADPERGLTGTARARAHAAVSESELQRLAAAQGAGAAARRLREEHPLEAEAGGE